MAKVVIETEYTANRPVHITDVTNISRLPCGECRLHETRNDEGRSPLAQVLVLGLLTDQDGNVTEGKIELDCPRADWSAADCTQW